MAGNETLTNKKFYKAVRSMWKRNENHKPREIIHDKYSSPLIEPTEVTKKWREYFNELLNPLGDW